VRTAARFTLTLLLAAAGGWATGQPTPAQPAPKPAALVPAQPMPGMPPAQPVPAQPLPGVPIPGQPGFVPVAPPRPMSQAVIDETVNRAVSFLRKAQNPAGTWGEGKDVGSGGGWVVGYTCLAGLALIENGVAKDDPGLRRAQAVVRAGFAKIDSTYEVALAILFLDRMGDPKDKGYIQGLAVRLIVGQTGTGGWAYKVPLVGGPDQVQILGTLRKMTPTSAPSGFSFRDRPSAIGLCIKTSDDTRPKPAAKSLAPPADPDKGREAALAALPGGIRRLAVFTDPDKLVLADPEGKASDPVNGTSDNSNTHFATIGLWAARRHDVPTERSFALLMRRFRTSQGADGGWGYLYVKGGGGGAPAMTCIALLGVAIGHALALDKDAGARPEQDPLVLKAFGMLGKRVGAPTGRADNRPSVKDVGGLYYLWALERIAVLYDVKTLDQKDWYQWGAEILVGHQLPDGSWAEGGYHGQHPVLNTALAVLFLKRANLTPDLSKRLILDTTVLAASVGGPAPVKPPVVAPPPEPTPEPVAKAETPTPKVETPAPKPAATPTPAAAAASSSPPAESSGSSLWLIVGAVLVLLVGGGVLFVMRSKAAAAAAKPKKKKKGSKKAVVVVEEVDDADEEEEDDEEEERPRKKSAAKGGGKT